MNELHREEKELFMRYGSGASEAMFDFSCSFFRIPDCVGIIPYRIEFGCAIVFGDPICPPEELTKLTEAFQTYCREKNWNVIYVIASEKFAKWAKDTHCHISIEVCEELTFDPAQDPCQTSNRLRHRVEKALKRGLSVHEYIPFDAQIENALQEVGSQWQKSIKGPNVYLGHLNFFESHLGKRWFYVKDNDQITAMIMLSQIGTPPGWLLKFQVFSPAACHDTTELLMVSVLKILKEENCRFLTKGMAPAADLGEIHGLGRFSTLILRGAYKIISKTFKFKQRKEYWYRYHPEGLPAYLLFTRPHIGLREMRALTKIFRHSVRH